MSRTLLKKKADEEEPSNFGLACVFKYEELKQFTNSFDTELGAGGFGKVYLGTLPDGRKVAVKVLFDPNPKRRLEQFFNEVSSLSRLRHKNLVALYGCTSPHNQELLLVYDYVPNGTVADHLHGQRSDLNLALRIQIAVETAEALSYLHALEPPIIHRDVKTSNILLDNSFHVKLADLGICRLLPWDTTHVSTVPQGTMGYRDPEYERYCRLSVKSDVYSFGVVLAELISGQEAVDVNRNPEDIYLDRLVLEKILNKKIKDIVDPKLGYHSNREVKSVINSVAKLAHKCLHPKALVRPSMVKVLSVLKEIQNEMLEIGQNVVDVMSFSRQQDLGYGNLNNESHKIMKEIQKESQQIGLNEVDAISFRPQQDLVDGSLNNGVEVVLTDMGGGGGDGNEQQRPAGNQKPKPPQASSVLLKIERHCECEACTEKILKTIRKVKGVECVTMDAKDQVTVKGTMIMKTLPILVQEKLKRAVEIMPQNRDDDGGKGGEKKTEGGGGRGEEKKKEDGGATDKKTEGGGIGGEEKKNEGISGDGADEKENSGVGGEENKKEGDGEGGVDKNEGGGDGGKEKDKGGEGDAEKKEGSGGGGKEKNECGVDTDKMEMGNGGVEEKNKDGHGGGGLDNKKKEGGNGGGEEKKREGSGGGDVDKKEEGVSGGEEERKNEDGGGGGTDKKKECNIEKEEGKVVTATLNKMDYNKLAYDMYRTEMTHGHPSQMFSDENPNACSIL